MFRSPGVIFLGESARRKVGRVYREADRGSRPSHVDQMARRSRVECQGPASSQPERLYLFVDGIFQAFPAYGRDFEDTGAARRTDQGLVFARQGSIFRR